MLVSLTDANLQAGARTDGNDILFTASDGVTKLNHEIEQYNGASGNLIAWVRLPSLSPVTDTVIYMYYGNPSSASQQNSSGVWDSNYAAVYHLGNGTTVSAKDSTGHANGTINGTLPVGAGKIGGGASFMGSAANYISAPNTPFAALGNNFTMEAWCSSSSAARKTILSWNDQATTPELEMNHHAGQVSTIVPGDYKAETGAGVVPNDGSMHHLVYTKAGSGATHQLYIDGNAQSLTVNSNVTYVSPANPLWIGKRKNASQPWSGVLDEIRISTTARSSDWIQTEYQNHSAPGSFFTIGRQE
jgi:hypothetical protein